jgi:hypothetical protein
MADKKAAIDVVFGALPKKGGAGGGDDEEESRTVLVDALKDGDPDTIADAIHEYILSCTGGKSPAMGKDEEEPMSSEEY